MSQELAQFLAQLKARYPSETEFHQAVTEVAKSVWPFIEKNPKYQKAKILERMVEPERVIMFRVTWMDRNGEVQINRGYRVQMNSAIGPYKGGLRFHPSVTLGTLKFLAFEQVFKNSLTTLPMGGGKGGSDFDPKGKTDEEVMRFCQAFMSELFRHIGPDTDVPAGDIGVGGREIGYLFGQYKKLRNEFTGVLTGKGINWSGSRIREEATGYGLVYFVEEMLRTRAATRMSDKVVTISGSGNVAQFAAEKAMLMGGKVVTFSDSDGFVYDPEGVDGGEAGLRERVEERAARPHRGVRQTVQVRVPRRPAALGRANVTLRCPARPKMSRAARRPRRLFSNGCICVGEGANMPSTPEAVDVFLGNKILFGPGKAANAGGVSVSGLEMSQNSIRLQWTSDEVDKRLSDIMKAIHNQCVRFGEQDGWINYVDGANIGGFRKVAEAMLDQGLT